MNPFLELDARCSRRSSTSSRAISILDDALDGPGTFEAKNALLRVQRAWNVLDCALADEWQVKIVNGSMVMVPFYDEGTHERDKMLQFMRKQMKKQMIQSTRRAIASDSDNEDAESESDDYPDMNESRYIDPDRDATQDLLFYFGKLPVGQQHRLHAIAEQCIETCMVITDADVVEVLGIV